MYKAKELYDPDYKVIYDEVHETYLAAIHPASEESVNEVLNAPVNTGDGRSEWVWLRLPNGDLILGVFPQGETYFAVEVDAAFPR